MSQIYKSILGGGGGPGTPILSVTGDSGGAVFPNANNIFLIGGSSTTNNIKGITVIGNPGTSTETFTLTNRISGSGTTANATPLNIATFSLGATPGVYNFDIQIVGYDLTDLAGCGYFISGSVRTTGAAAILVGTPDKITNEEAATVPCDANLVVSGNNAIVQVTGILGKNINWVSLSQYIFIS